MTFFSAHIKAGNEPVLVREGFAIGAVLFGPLWLCVHRAWIPAALSLAGFVLIVVWASGSSCGILVSALAGLLGLTGNDLRRWSLERRGYLLRHILAARDDEDALLRLLTHRPDLASGYQPEAA